MSRLVVISNRLADPRKPAAGGLAVALGEALNQTGGLWFGWSGTVVEGGTPGEGELHTRQAGAVTLATVDLCREDHDSYYHGYSNTVLWPVFHYRLDLADFNASYIAGYRRVNQMFARKLLPLLRDDDVIWVHDYHLIPLAAELRAMGCKHRIGFFLHIPMPPPLIMAAIPQHEWLMRSLFAYDLVGLQSEADVSHFTRYVRNEGSAEEVDEKRVRAFGATVVVQSFPIGIDVDEFTRLTHAPDAVETYENMRDEYSRRRLLLGIDRLDYSKGIPQRVRAFRELLDRYPENRDSATLIMIASPTRDGMNLVAKEYVVAQDPDDPGVLVLSRFAGAAEQLKEALLVNPYDTQGMADSIQQALQMPLVERQARHQKLMARIRQHDVHWWRKAFLDALQAAG